VLLESGLGVLGPIVAPELLDQAVGRDDGSRLEQEHREHASLLRSTEADLPRAVARLERPENAEFEALGQGATVARPISCLEGL
jgi:hypothetical protein